MKIKIISIGKTKEDWVATGINEYLKRLKRYVQLEYIELASGKIHENNTIELALGEETKRFESALKSGDQIFLLDNNGVESDSVEFAEWINKRFSAGGGDLVFLIGGPYGFHDSLRNRAKQSISLSRMTFTHQMVRIVFLEQVYRAMTILRNEPYHHF
ncbi:MAG: 23S rRNA (pseudouridine(1915)-N(3))-methyltransferase RlmH [Sphingobacteriales bacterium]|nr:23S rRNA (pseudouridine(1915)-N(3))-methyltransferase RlmH [Sphingobacteriales bacterium]